MRYAELIVSLSNSKSSVDKNFKKGRKKAKCESVFWISNSKFELSTPFFVFNTSSEMSIKVISAIHAEFIKYLSILEGSAYII